MKKLYTYTLPRPFSGYNIPIAIQSLYLRSYAQKNLFLFSLPVTEIMKKDCYNMFIENFSKKKIDLAMTSIFMLPISNVSLLNKLLQNMHIKTEIHFVLENLVLDRKKIKNWRDKFLEVANIPDDYHKTISDEINF